MLDKHICILGRGDRVAGLITCRLVSWMYLFLFFFHLHRSLRLHVRHDVHVRLPENGRRRGRRRSHVMWFVHAAVQRDVAVDRHTH